MEKEYLIMDDGGNLIPEQMTPEMSAAYEKVKATIDTDFSDLFSD